jgi:hypothetical protein
MRNLVLLSAAIASLIAVPSAFAHGKSTGHSRLHASTRHATHRHHDSTATDRTAAVDQTNHSERRSARQPDEEEVAIDELASKAN